jgi:hypothetical protein
MKGNKSRQAQNGEVVIACENNINRGTPLNQSEKMFDKDGDHFGLLI